MGLFFLRFEKRASVKAPSCCGVCQARGEILHAARNSYLAKKNISLILRAKILLASEEKISERSLEFQVAMC